VVFCIISLTVVASKPPQYLVAVQKLAPSSDICYNQTLSTKITHSTHNNKWLCFKARRSSSPFNGLSFGTLIEAID